MASYTEMVDEFENFLRERYEDDLGQAESQGEKSVSVDFEDLEKHDHEFADEVLENPEDALEATEEAVERLSVVDTPLKVRFSNLPEGEKIKIRDLRSDHIGRFVAVKGIVKRASEVRPEVVSADFECTSCGDVYTKEQDSSKLKSPYKCDCGNRKFEVVDKDMVDVQAINIEENPRNIEGSEQPRDISIYLRNDLVDPEFQKNVTPGNEVVVNGVLKEAPQDNDSRRYDIYMEGNHVTPKETEFKDIDITDEEEERIQELAESDDILDRVVNSIAPSIYGHERVKEAIALQLFGGVRKERPDGTVTRGDMHVLLIGEPGTGKCVAPDTRVTLADGRRRDIRELVEENLEEPEEVDDGFHDRADIRLPSMDHDGRVEEKRGTRVWKRESPERMYRIRTSSGKEVEVTPSHPLFVHSRGKIRAVEAEDLEEGEFIAAPRNISVEGHNDIDIDYRESRSNNAARFDDPEELDPSMARLLAYITAEGHVQKNDDNTATAYITNSDTEVLEDVKSSLDELGLNYSERKPHEERSAREITCSSGEFASFLENLEPSLLERSRDRRVPEQVMRSTEDVRKGFLKAFIEGEGTVSRKEREISVGSTSEELLRDLETLLLSLGIRSQFRPRKDSYRLRISGGDFGRYVDRVGFVTGRKSDLSESHAGTDSNTNLDVVPHTGELLRETREGLGLSQFDFPVSRGAYQHYERLDRFPSRDNLGKVAERFRSRLENLREMRQQLEDPDWGTVREIRNSLGVSQRAVSENVQGSQTLLSRYESGRLEGNAELLEEAAATLRGEIDAMLHHEPRVRDIEGLAESGIIWERIEEVEEVEPEYDWVYDLQVEDTHNYITNNVFSHNSQVLKYVGNLAPKGKYVVGKSATGAGITATVVRDEVTDSWSLEAGALVLANKGIATIDEIDKMSSEDRSSLHEAMEQQSYHPDSEILLADGKRVRVGDYVDRLMEENRDKVIDGVNCEILPVDGLEVHSTDLENKETEKLPVDRVSRHEAPDEFVEVEFSNGRSVTVTPEHPMFADINGDIGTVRADEIEEGMFVPAPRKLPNSPQAVTLSGEKQAGTEKEVELPDRMSPELAEILGLLTAEGHSYAGSSHEIGFSNQDDRLLERMDRLMGEVFGMESTDTSNELGTVTKRWVSTRLYRWFESNFPEFMDTAEGKRIPAKVLGASEEEIRRFLVGAFAGDGGVETEAMAFSTISEGLAEDYADALSKIGVASRMQYDRSEDRWKTYVMGDSTEKFVDRVVEPADDRHGKAVEFAERSRETSRHHDVLPTSAAREIRELRRISGLSLTGEFRQHLDNGYGVQVETVEREVDNIRKRTDSVREELEDAETLAEVREAAGWSGRQLAERMEEATTSSIHYAENGGYSEARRDEMFEEAVGAAENAMEDADERLRDLENRCRLRYYRVRDVKKIPNRGEDSVEWVYDMTVEPTHNFVSNGVLLHNTISVSKANIQATLQAQTAILAAGNPKFGRFDPFEPIPEQINIGDTLLSRFDLIFPVKDKPDQEKDQKLADHVISMHREPETHVGDIETELLRKYIAYAKKNVRPELSDTAQKRLKEFYVNIRGQGSSEEGERSVPMTARQLEALIRLSEAAARARLSETVEERDAETAIDLLTYSLKQIGTDPETGEFDIDRIESGISSSDRNRMQSVQHIISELQEGEGEAVPMEDVLAEAEEQGISEEEAEKVINRLKRNGEVFEPKTGHIQKI
ncbi:MAG: LAGLIDADG family homing endonuclease [Candidatus Nanohaloarchaea archaeon]|nr:LAGLIDADG family homing endonuclease [Candidatus Nanohaloarchaea archaeon]